MLDIISVDLFFFFFCTTPVLSDVYSPGGHMVDAGFPEALLHDTTHHSSEFWAGCSCHLHKIVEGMVISDEKERQSFPSVWILGQKLCFN